MTSEHRKTVLVTGATGFVGGNLIPSLVGAGFSVRALYRTKFVGSLVSARHVDWVRANDLSAECEFDRFVEGVDSIVHLAARVHQMGRHSPLDAERFDDINRRATVKLAEAASRARVLRFVFLSSIKVNGESTAGRAFTAKDEPHPADAYARSKLAAERELQTISVATGLDTWVVRSPLVYGPGAAGNLAVLALAVQNRRVLPLAGIVNRRTLVSVSNLASLVIAALNIRAGGYRVVLAGDARSLSTPKIIRAISRGLKVEARLVRVPVPALRLLGSLTGNRERVDRLCDDLEIDICPTQDVLNWQPSVDPEDGLQEFGCAFNGQGPGHG